MAIPPDIRCGFGASGGACPETGAGAGSRGAAGRDYLGGRVELAEQAALKLESRYGETSNESAGA